MICYDAPSPSESQRPLATHPVRDNKRTSIQVLCNCGKSRVIVNPRPLTEYDKTTPLRNKRPRSVIFQ